METKIYIEREFNLWILQLLVIILTIKKFGKNVHMNQNLKGSKFQNFMLYNYITSFTSH